jgi:hypothetical protein
VKIHDCQQGSSSWLQLRAGIPTASCFDRIVTPKTGKPSASAEKYLHRLLAEKIMGHPITDQAVTSWMSRGTELEGDAVLYYEAQRDLDTMRVGFMSNDDGTIGASPDRLVGDVGLLEVKCHNEEKHIGYLLTREADADHRAQVQGQLWVSGRRWADLLCFHPELPACIIRVERDEPYIALLAEHVGAFVDRLAEATQRATDSGWIKPRRNVIDDMLREQGAA